MRRRRRDRGLIIGLNAQSKNIRLGVDVSVLTDNDDGGAAGVGVGQPVIAGGDDSDGFGLAWAEDKLCVAEGDVLIAKA